MPTVIAHRGASAHAPEHTLDAYDRALADGADRLDSTSGPWATARSSWCTTGRSRARAGTLGRWRSSVRRTSSRLPGRAHPRARPPVNDPNEMARLAAIGVDGLITDVPDVAGGAAVPAALAA